MSLTYNELIAMGLSEDEAKAIATNTENQGGGGGLPFPQLKINYDTEVGKAGQFVFDVKKDKDGNIESVGGVYDSIEFIPVAFRCQHSKYDQASNKSVVSSNILPTRESKSCVDLKSGILISKLKETDDKIKYSKIMVGILKDGKENKPFLMYLSGSALAAFNDGMPEDAVVKNKVKVGGTTKGKKGSVTYYTPSDFEVVPLSDKDVMANIKQVAEVSKKFNDWVAQVNGAGTAPKSSGTKSAPVSDAGEGDGDISWD
jgi:hypothetical protein